MTSTIPKAPPFRPIPCLSASLSNAHLMPYSYYNITDYIYYAMLYIYMSIL